MKHFFTKGISAVVAAAMLFSSTSASLFVNVYADEASADGAEEVVEALAYPTNLPDPVTVESSSFWLEDNVDDDLGGIPYGVYNLEGGKLTLLPGLNGENYATKVDIVTDDNGVTHTTYKSSNRPTECNAYSEFPDSGSAVAFSPDAKGMMTVWYSSSSFIRVNTFANDESGTPTGAPLGYVDSGVSSRYYSFAVEPGNTYLMATTGKTNNLGFAGFEYIKDEEIDVTFNAWTKDERITDDSKINVTLTDKYLGTAVETAVTKDGGTIKLLKGHTYEIKSSDGGAQALIGSVDGGTSFEAGTDAVSIYLKYVPDVKLSGKFTSNADGVGGSCVKSFSFTDINDPEAVFAFDSSYISGNNYSVMIKPGNYKTSVVTTNGSETYDRVEVVEDTDNTNEIYLEVPSLSDVTYALDEEINKESSVLTFEGFNYHGAQYGVYGGVGAKITVPIEPNTTVTVTGGYDGRFSITGTSGNSVSSEDAMTATYAAGSDDTEVVIEVTAVGNVAQNSGSAYIKSVAVGGVPVAFKSTLKVPGDYATLKEANAAVKAMENRPEGESGRVTIELTKDIQEQIVFDAPYLTLNGKGHEINWYYGQTGFYYSVDSSGYYSERLFRDKYEKTEASGNLWGGVAIIRSDNFKALNTTFRNTFNYEVTPKEVEDGAYINLVNCGLNTLDTNVQSYAHKERSNAFYIEADNIEVYNCKILSSQDALGRNGSANNGYHTYFKNCVIGGNVDYICGEFTAVFDNCELQWKTYRNDDGTVDTNSNKGVIGYLAVPKTSPYIFRNCKITTDADYEGQDLSALKGKSYYGRTWGASSQAYFVNCETNGWILESDEDRGAWGEMNSGDFATSVFYEYGNVSNGVEFISNAGRVLSDEAKIASYTGDGILDVLGWTPDSYKSGSISSPVEERVNKGGIGDVTGGEDGISPDDTEMIIYSVIDPETFENAANFDSSKGDVDGDGIVNVGDALMILEKYINNNYTLPAEQIETAQEAQASEAAE